MPHTCTKWCSHRVPRLTWKLFTHSGTSRLKHKHINIGAGPSISCGRWQFMCADRCSTCERGAQTGTRTWRGCLPACRTERRCSSARWSRSDTRPWGELTPFGTLLYLSDCSTHTNKHIILSEPHETSQKLLDTDSFQRNQAELWCTFGRADKIRALVPTAWASELFPHCQSSVSPPPQRSYPAEKPPAPTGSDELTRGPTHETGTYPHYIKLFFLSDTQTAKRRK